MTSESLPWIKIFRYIFMFPVAIVSGGLAASIGWYLGGLVPDFLLPLTVQESERWIFTGIMSAWFYYFVGFSVSPTLNRVSKWILVAPMYLAIPVAVLNLVGPDPERAWNAFIVAIFTVYLSFLSPEEIHQFMGTGRLENSVD